MRRTACTLAFVAVLLAVSLPAAAAPIAERSLGERVQQIWHEVLTLIGLAPTEGPTGEHPSPPVESMAGNEESGPGMDPAG